MITEDAIKFNERCAHWSSQGKTGEAFYDALASDPELPPFFGNDDIADIMQEAKITPRMRRQRGSGPVYLKPSSRKVIYPRADFVNWLRSKLVKTAA